MSEVVFSVVFIADHREVSGIHLSVTLSADSIDDALNLAKVELINNGYYNVEALSVHVAEDDVPLGIRCVADD
ncbi:hypothetical protein L2D25_02225 [Salmonella enterica subsp. enterica serovar Muenchen]|uniref:hypothetical protein n=1 Tax=Salmonella enterica TaxID=28901 RepID=UPI001288B745|nr:hypothetical protein [Salmonella enterica]ECI3890075.1 hypothetical protein [Salmonella enterica subsp. enterica serovar Gombe]EDW2057023.1 hypothetical protein [Salmonella enterica subsp. enterica]ECY7601087.1 hypothetical protein [Salmonella enterica subsp. enterica serovar Muenchen]EEJ6213070.1 hypothetical protein [Salmonella enterica]MCH5440301.1 hypothetical protein [Salmonella enterica subsp. enterica serovar Muenchen]